MNHRGDGLRHTHAALEFAVDKTLVSYRELSQVNRLCALKLVYAEIAVELIGKERSERSEQLSDSLKTSIESLISSQLVLRHVCAPETFAVKTNVPVAEVVVHEVDDETTGACRVVAFHLLCNILHESVEHREHPTVNLRTLCHRNKLSISIELVYVGIAAEE